MRGQDRWTPVSTFGISFGVPDRRPEILKLAPIGCPRAGGDWDRAGCGRYEVKLGTPGTAGRHRDGDTCKQRSVLHVVVIMPVYLQNETWWTGAKHGKREALEISDWG